METSVAIKTKNNIIIEKDDLVTITTGYFFKKHYKGRISNINMKFFSDEYWIELDSSKKGESEVMDFCNSNIKSIEHNGIIYDRNNYIYKPFIVNSKNERAYIGDTVLLKYNNKEVLAKFVSYHYHGISFDASLDYFSKMIRFFYSEVDEADFELC